MGDLEEKWFALMSNAETQEAVLKAFDSVSEDIESRLMSLNDQLVALHMHSNLTRSMANSELDVTSKIRFVSELKAKVGEHKSHIKRVIDANIFRGNIFPHLYEYDERTTQNLPKYKREVLTFRLLAPEEEDDADQPLLGSGLEEWERKGNLKFSAQIQERVCRRFDRYNYVLPADETEMWYRSMFLGAITTDAVEVAQEIWAEHIALAEIHESSGSTQVSDESGGVPMERGQVALCNLPRDFHYKAEATWESNVPVWDPTIQKWNVMNRLKPDEMVVSLEGQNRTQFMLLGVEHKAKYENTDDDKCWYMGACAIKQMMLVTGNSRVTGFVPFVMSGMSGSTLITRCVCVLYEEGMFKSYEYKEWKLDRRDQVRDYFVTLVALILHRFSKVRKIVDNCTKGMKYFTRFRRLGARPRSKSSSPLPFSNPEVYPEIVLGVES